MTEVSRFTARNALETRGEYFVITILEYCWKTHIGSSRKLSSHCATYNLRIFQARDIITNVKMNPLLHAQMSTSRYLVPLQKYSV